MPQYSYNNKKFFDIFRNTRLTRHKVRKVMDVSSDVTVKRWEEGEDIYIERLVEFCNAFDYSPLDFFLKDGEPMIEAERPLVSSENLDISPDSVQFIIQKEKEINDLKMLHQKELFNLKEELYKQRELHINEMTDKILSLKEEERQKLDEQREQDRANYAKQLAIKDEEIAKLKHNLNVLQLEYKELEMSVSKSPYGITAIAEPNINTYKKHP